MDKPIKDVWNEAHQRANVSALRKRAFQSILSRALRVTATLTSSWNEQVRSKSLFPKSRSCGDSKSFCLGRPAENMPQITSRICGVCPTAHHMASTKALDDLYQVEADPRGQKIRELMTRSCSRTMRSTSSVLAAPISSLGAGCPSPSTAISWE